MKKPVFLKAQWRKLMMANYAIDPAALTDYIPAHTQLDLWEGQCLVSLVGFMFKDTRVRGFKIPGHVNFEEINLRFYITHETGDGEIRRGTSFIKEIVKRPAITWVANTLYKEQYHTMPTRHRIQQHEKLDVQYEWQYRNRWNTMACKAAPEPSKMPAGSEEEFITEHYWGYTRLSETETAAYAVEHPRWEVYPVHDYTIDADFGTLYGQQFAHLSKQKPVSVLLAEGSEILVRKGFEIR